MRNALLIASGAVGLVVLAAVAVLSRYAGPAIGESIRDLHTDRRSRRG